MSEAVTTPAARRAETHLPALRQHAAEHEQRGLVGADLLGTLRDDGLLTLVTPSHFGGGETSFSEVFDVTRILAQGCMSTSWIATVGNVHNWIASAFSETAQGHYFTDPGVYSSASFAPTGTARMREDGLVAEGTWGFLSGVDHAQWVFLNALVKDPIDGKPAGPWFLMVPRKDVTVLEDSWQVTGLAGTGSKSVRLDDVFVPFDHARFLPALMTDEYEPLHDGALFRAPFHAALIAVLAAPIVGAGQAMVTQYLDYTRSRIVKMTGARQSEQIPTQVTLAEADAGVTAAETLLRAVFQRIDADEPLSPIERAQIPRDVAYAARLVNDAANTIMRNAGGSAAQLSNPLQRYWRDIQTACNHAALNWATSAQAWGAAALSEGA